MLAHPPGRVTARRCVRLLAVRGGGRGLAGRPERELSDLHGLIQRESSFNTAGLFWQLQPYQTGAVLLVLGQVQVVFQYKDAGGSSSSRTAAARSCNANASIPLEGNASKASARRYSSTMMAFHLLPQVSEG